MKPKFRIRIEKTFRLPDRIIFLGPIEKRDNSEIARGRAIVVSQGVQLGEVWVEGEVFDDHPLPSVWIRNDAGDICRLLDLASLEIISLE